MALLSDLAMLRTRVAASGSRLEKRRLVAEYLRELTPEDLPRAVTYLSGRAFPASDPRVLNVRSLPAPGATPSPATPLTLADVARVAIWSRRLSEVTGSLPDIVDIARRDLRGAPFILDGEVVALDAAGRPLPFQELMRRFRRVRGVEAAAGTMPLTLHLFDCLMADGRSYLDEPYARRWEVLERVTGGRWLAERVLVTRAEDGTALMARA